MKSKNIIFSIIYGIISLFIFKAIMAEENNKNFILMRNDLLYDLKVTVGNFCWQLPAQQSINDRYCDYPDNKIIMTIPAKKTIKFFEPPYPDRFSNGYFTSNILEIKDSKNNVFNAEKDVQGIYTSNSSKIIPVYTFEKYLNVDVNIPNNISYYITMKDSYLFPMETNK